MAISRAWNEEILLCFHHFRQNVIYGASTRTCLSCHIYPLNNDAFTQVRTYNDRIVHAFPIFSQGEDSGAPGRHPPRVRRRRGPPVHRHRRPSSAHQLDEGWQAGEYFSKLPFQKYLH